MDLHEEYFSRRKVPAYLIKYVDRANLILKAKEGSNTDSNWLHVSIDYKTDSNHPSHYQFVVAANPVIYASTDFSHFSYHHTKVIAEQRWEWDQYESGIMNWATQQAHQYVAVPSCDAVLVSWEMFLTNYDSWLANFVPYRVIDHLAGSLVGNKEERINKITEVENWMSSKFERVLLCWKNIRQNLDQKSYADWLADIINDMGKRNVRHAG